MVRFNKEVLLCAGAIASPQILQRSGVGNPELLRQFDIPDRAPPGYRTA
jgi:choline dehydrogenase